LRTFLREIEDRASQNNPPTYPGIHLGTIHSAKGLEWPIVFLVGVGDQFFPYQNPWLTTPLTETSTFAEAADLIESSLSNVEPNARIEEERRLLYVGITRAQKLAHLSFVGNPSPFVAAWNKNN